VIIEKSSHLLAGIFPAFSGKPAACKQDAAFRLSRQGRARRLRSRGRATLHKPDEFMEDYGV
jgi:hypothetical protein